MTQEQKDLHEKKWDNPNDRNGILNVSKKSKVNKQNLSRYSVSTKELKDQDVVYGYEEESDEVSELRAEMKDGEIVLKDQKGFMVRFIDIIFKTEKEANKYKSAPFM